MPQQDKNLEDMMLKQLDKRLHNLRFALECLIPAWQILDRKILSLKGDIDSLEKKRVELTQGQLIFDCDRDF